MTESEVQKLFRMFVAIKPAWQPAEDTALAWSLILEPYSYEAVREASAACFRKSRYIPDPAEIIAEISTHAPRDDTLSPREIEELDKYAELKRRRAAEGLPPTLSSAKEYGYKTMELLAKYEELGLSISSPPAPKHEVSDAEVREVQAFLDSLRRARA